jgi:hypothetical protein
MTAAVDYDGRRFRPVVNTPNGEVSGETLFRYHQHGAAVWATYEGGGVTQGHLIATADAQGVLDMRYHHLNAAGELMTGRCRSTPERLADGRLRLHEEWQWTSGDGSVGRSVVEEVAPGAST